MYEPVYVEMAMTRLPDSAHTERPWLVHEIAPDFTLDDVWRIDLPGAGAEDFDRARTALDDAIDTAALNPVARLLFAVRWWLGSALGWDEEEGGVGHRVPPVADRVPAHLRPGPTSPTDSPFAPVYRLPDETASEIANSTVHGLFHLGWVRTEDGGHALHLASLIRPNGAAGQAYMTLIKPFRVLVVWPSIVRAAERSWREREPVRGGIEGHPPAGLTISPDYVDRFELTTDVVASPREWATAMFADGVPRPARELLFGAILGCSLVEDSAPGSIAGLRVERANDQQALLAMEGPRVRSNLLVEVGDGRVALTTAHEYASPLGRLVWTLVSIRHRQLAAPLLREAAAHLRSRTVAAGHR